MSRAFLFDRDHDAERGPLEALERRESFAQAAGASEKIQDSDRRQAVTPFDSNRFHTRMVEGFQVPDGRCRRQAYALPHDERHTWTEYPARDATAQRAACARS